MSDAVDETRAEVVSESEAALNALSPPVEGTVMSGSVTRPSVPVVRETVVEPSAKV
ncbi:hypothetical protein [Rathayibacter tritici]|uniref:hypothetical protein n=1 Tax=Rathayibacter tritici TaxID=33888 RepID=UPI0015E1DF05|nr:hypothetical protein [Rathayibacter tritici]